MKYKTIDLCAGIGGVRRGFEMTEGFTNVLSAEIDACACTTYAQLFHESVEEVHNDLTSPTFKSKVNGTPFDVLLAGFPCQTFSIAGKKKGFADSTKGTIFFHIQEILAANKPKAIFLENVAHLLSHDKGRTINTIFRVLDEVLNYQIVGLSGEKAVVTVDGYEEIRYVFNRKNFVRNTKDFGLPQNRPRCFIVALSRDHYPDGKLDFLKHESVPMSPEKVICRSLGDLLINDVNDVDDSLYLSQRYWDTLKKHREAQHKAGRGFGYKIVYDFENPDSNAVASTLLATGGSGKERNLIRQPKQGIAGKTVKGKRWPLNADGIRVMSPIEWGRLQGFMGYGFVGGKKVRVENFPAPHLLGVSKGQLYKQFGNSVSIPVIRSLADYMLCQLRKLDSAN